MRLMLSQQMLESKDHPVDWMDIRLHERLCSMFNMTSLKKYIQRWKNKVFVIKKMEMQFLVNTQMEWTTSYSARKSSLVLKNSSRSCILQNLLQV